MVDIASSNQVSGSQPVDRVAQACASVVNEGRHDSCCGVVSLTQATTHGVSELVVDLLAVARDAEAIGGLDPVET
jgi:hypothetical protein